jgi:hypothetical protein
MSNTQSNFQRCEGETGGSPRTGRWEQGGTPNSPLSISVYPIQLFLPRRLFPLMQDMCLDELALAGGEGTDICAG